MEIGELIKMIAAAIGAALGGWFSARQANANVSQTLVRIEAKLEVYEARFEAVEARLGAVEQQLVGS